jgi:hypothetical protein
MVRLRKHIDIRIPKVGAEHGLADIEPADPKREDLAMVAG